jgi:WxcM-like, C-terminal
MPLDQCSMVDLPRIENSQGNLSVVESNRHIPFGIERVYYLYDVPGGAERGGHAHRQLQQLIIAATGSFEVELDDGYAKRQFFLNRSYYGLYVAPMIWRTVRNFSSGSVCLVLASAWYHEDDYFREYEEFLNAARDR